MVTNVVIIGYVDHGKSTLVGWLLSDTKSVSETLITKVQSACDMKGKQFEYAYLLMHFRNSQEQGVTHITKTPVFVHDGKEYMLIDAPGHKQFIKNMVSGAAFGRCCIIIDRC